MKQNKKKDITDLTKRYKFIDKSVRPQVNVVILILQLQ